MNDDAGPTSHSYFSQRLKLHYVDWGNEDKPALLMVHGNRDHSRNWDWVARALRDDYHIIAPDLRGHGDSQSLMGTHYQTLDYVYDIAQLVDQKKLEPVRIISHSMGANISIHYSGVFPEKVCSLIAIEGLFGTPEIPRPPEYQKSTVDRIKAWVEETRTLSSRLPRRYADLETAFKRMQTENPHLSEEKARLLTIHGSTQNEDGSYSWKFDNYVRQTSPVRLQPEEVRAIIKRIDCPTLLIQGSDSWATDPNESGWLNLFQKGRSVIMEDAGHWVHHDQLDVFLDLAKAHLQGS